MLKFFRTLPQHESEPAPSDYQRKSAVYADEALKRESSRAAKRLARDMDAHSHRRQDERGVCFTPAELHNPETGARVHGVVLDASRFGVTFRPMSHYIQDRTGERVQLVCAGMTRIGVVRSSRPDGYGIQVTEAFSDADLHTIYRGTIAVVAE